MNAFTSRLPLLIALGLLFVAVLLVIFMLPSGSQNPSPDTTVTVEGLATSSTESTTTSPYLFGNRNLSFDANFSNTLGCDWQGIGGQVLDLEGEPYLSPLMVEVTGGGLPSPITASTGGNTLYGASGFEIQLAASPNSNTYFAQLKSTAGTAISDIVQISFPETCEGNLALVNFVQQREQ